MTKDKRLHKIPGHTDVKWDDKHSDEFRGDVEETGIGFMGYDWDSKEEQFKVYLHYDQLYYWKYAEVSKLGKGFVDGEFWGTKCPKCGDKFFPPRVNCWNLDDNLEKTEWIQLKEEGIVHTFTVAGWSGKSSLKRLPFILAYVIVDGCKTAIANELRGIEPWEAEFGMPVKVVWKPKKERQGTVTDWHFEPADGWKPGPMNEEKERIKELCQPVIEWVKTMK
ncbi:MAG: Zn-ribbon domain-containing OB-fold protein [Promethearchaeota archaeon]